ncbi:hypothetical protein [Akkermansia sp. AKK6]
MPQQRFLCRDAVFRRGGEARDSGCVFPATRRIPLLPVQRRHAQAVARVSRRSAQRETSRFRCPSGMIHAGGITPVPARTSGSQVKALWESRMTAVKASPAASVRRNAGRTGRSVSRTFFFMAHMVPASRAVKNSGASRAAEGMLFQYFHAQSGVAATRMPALLTRRRPRCGGADAAAWFISV